jgi:hypothetical protein
VRLAALGGWSIGVTGGAGYRRGRGAVAPVHDGVALAGCRYGGWAASVASGGDTKLAARGRRMRRCAAKARSGRRVGRAAGLASGEAVRGVSLSLIDALTTEARSMLFGSMTPFLDTSSSLPSPAVARACPPLHVKALAVTPSRISFHPLGIAERYSERDDEFRFPRPHCS